MFYKSLLGMCWIMLTLVACSPSSPPPANQSKTENKSAEPAKPAKNTSVIQPQLDALQKAKEVEGTIQKEAEKQRQDLDETTK